MAIVTAPKDEFIREIFKLLADEIEAVNHTNGWFDNGRSIGDGVALLHSEVSEAFDAWRKYGLNDTYENCSGISPVVGHVHDEKCKPVSYGSELADVLIRLLDQCRRDSIDLAYEYRRKIEYNRTRAYRHGGRRV